MAKEMTSLLRRGKTNLEALEIMAKRRHDQAINYGNVPQFQTAIPSTEITLLKKLVDSETELKGKYDALVAKRNAEVAKLVAAALAIKSSPKPHKSHK